MAAAAAADWALMPVSFDLGATDGQHWRRCKQLLASHDIAWKGRITPSKSALLDLLLIMIRANRLRPVLLEG
eukprot:2888157-Amphidinium_carterae.2